MMIIKAQVVINWIVIEVNVNWIKKVGLFVTALIPYLMENFVIITFVLIIVKMEDFVHIPCKKTNLYH